MDRKFGSRRLGQDDAARLADAQRRLNTLAVEGLLQRQLMWAKARDQFSELVRKFSQSLGHRGPARAEPENSALDGPHRLRSHSASAHHVARAQRERSCGGRSRPTLDAELEAPEPDHLRARVDAEDPDCRHGGMVASPAAAT